MCCFSKPVASVSNTYIFARSGADEHQFLVYSMSLEADQDLAMILPLPVAARSGEKAVQFIDLKAYREFFDDLKSGFPIPPAPDSSTHTRGGMISASLPKLEVIQVGDFEASFVPTVSDFSRLDERFRLPTETWAKLPQYQDHGFAIFKLKPGAQRVHPMAFSFPRRNPRELFFPTVHIHDGQVHAQARYDHELYCQPNENNYPHFGRQWEESQKPAKGFMKVGQARGLVEADQHCYRRRLHGTQANRDTILRVEG